MRRFATILILLFSFTMLSAQKKTDVKRYVDMQIKNAIGIERNSPNETSKGTILKLMILLTASVASFGYVFYRRRKISQIRKEAELKKRLEVLKNEKLTYTMEPKLKMIRRKLSDIVPEGKINIGSVPKSAKRLSIAQEEILLAARLNYYSKQSKAGGYVG